MEKLRSAASASCSCDRSMVIASTVLSTWMVINVALNFWNKYVLSPEGGPKGGLGFSFPVFYSTFHMARAATKLMMRKRFGRIIAITSVVGVTGNAGQVNYAASKAGLIGMMKSIGAEYARRNVTANCIAPGSLRISI